MENSKQTLFQDVRQLGRDVAQDVREGFSYGKIRGLKVLGVLTLLALTFLVGAVLVISYKLLRQLVLGVLRVPGRIRAGYRAFLHRHFDNIGLVGGFVVVVATSYGLFKLDPQTPTLSLATVQVLVSAPLLLFMEVHATIWCYKNLLPEPFRQLLGHLGEKLSESVLPPLEEVLHPGYGYFLSVTDELAIAKFKLQYHVLKFGIRCTRFVLYGIPFYLLFKAMEFNINLVLNLQPR